MRALFYTRCKSFIKSVEACYIFLYTEHYIAYFLCAAATKKEPCSQATQCMDVQFLFCVEGGGVHG